MRVRGAQHLEALEKPGSHPDNAFVRHKAEYHQGEEDKVEFKLELIGHYEKPVERQVCEGIYIHTDPSDVVMNSKVDHFLPAVSRVTFTCAVTQTIDTF